MYLIEKFVTTQPGEPYRLLPFGIIHKGGKERNITPEWAAGLKLPHFQPPIKLGSHEETTPAGGHIIAIEVRADGIYAIPEFNPNGTAALTEGHYRYHSPEIIFEGGFEHPDTGEMIEAPLIVGDALLHTPHLGGKAALYTVVPIKDSHKEITMTAETQDMVPVSALDKLKELFTQSNEPKPEPKPEPVKEPAAASEDFAAQIQAAKEEAEQYKAEVEALKAEKDRAERVAHFAAEFKEQPAIAEDADLHKLLAGLDEEVAKELTTKFKALAEQVKESNLTEDIGNEGEGEVDEIDALNAQVTKYAAENDVPYHVALKAIQQGGK